MLLAVAGLVFSFIFGLYVTLMNPSYSGMPLDFALTALLFSFGIQVILYIVPEILIGAGIGFAFLRFIKNERSAQSP